MLKAILQWLLFGAFIFYITAKVKCHHLWNATIGAWLRRPRITPIGGRHYVLSFYIGDTLCKIIVKRRGPPDFYAVTAPMSPQKSVNAIDNPGEYEEVTNSKYTGEGLMDVSDAVAPFFTVQEVNPTPASLGFETITFWDFEDNPVAVSGQNIITF